jgi:hypothetical protein
VTVGEVTRKLIASLEAGGPAARDCLLDVSELLRKAWHPGFVPAFDHLQAENITPEEAGLLRQALADYCQAEGSAAHRRMALVTIAKEGRSELQAQLQTELHLTLQAHRVLSGDLFQLLLALEDIGESVFPNELRSRGIDAVQANVDVAAAYLRLKGTLVPY